MEPYTDWEKKELKRLMDLINTEVKDENTKRSGIKD